MYRSNETSDQKLLKTFTALQPQQKREFVIAARAIQDNIETIRRILKTRHEQPENDDHIEIGLLTFCVSGEEES